MMETKKSAVATSGMCSNLIGGNKVVTVSAWLALRGSDILSGSTDDNTATVRLYEVVRQDLGDDLAPDDDGETMHPIYAQIVNLARTHGAEEWPVCALDAFIGALMPARDDEDLAEATGKLWDDALAAYEEHRAKARRRNGVFLG